MPLIDDVKTALAMETTTLYDGQIDLYINTAITELTTSGVPEQNEDSVHYKTYATAVALRTKILLYPDAPDDNLQKSFQRATTSLKFALGNYD